MGRNLCDKYQCRKTCNVIDELLEAWCTQLRLKNFKGIPTLVSFTLEHFIRLSKRITEKNLCAFSQEKAKIIPLEDIRIFCS